MTSTGAAWLARKAPGQAGGDPNRKEAIMTDKPIIGKAGTKARDTLDEARGKAQELHSAIIQALSSGAEAARSEVEAVVQKAQESADLAKAAMTLGYRAGEIRQQLQQAVDRLEDVRDCASRSVKGSGTEFRDSLTKALAEARSSVQHISEAVAAKRAEILADAESIEIKPRQPVT
jgi:ElaB/YqjD/DUF883 family membrane-anchored ribosome-binding protein